jgi:hypothetical protein
MFEQAYLNPNKIHSSIFSTKLGTIGTLKLIRDYSVQLLKWLEL